MIAVAMQDSDPGLWQVDSPAPERGRQPVPWGSGDIIKATGAIILAFIIAITLAVPGRQ